MKIQTNARKCFKRLHAILMNSSGNEGRRNVKLKFDKFLFVTVNKSAEKNRKRNTQ